MSAFAGLSAPPASRFVECETFTDYGGWVVDPHSMKRMGSSYLMAHGYGTPVRDAIEKIGLRHRHEPEMKD